MSTEQVNPMPVLYLSHGAPPLAEDAVWPGQLASWAAALPKPKAVLMVSAHWEDAPVALGAIETVPLVYDFWGFPQRYYEVRYPAPGAPELAEQVRKLLPHRKSQVLYDVPDRVLITVPMCRWSKCIRTRISRCSRCRCPHWTRPR